MNSKLGAGVRVTHSTDSQDILPLVNWLMLGSKLPGGRVPDPAFDPEALTVGGN